MLKRVLGRTKLEVSVLGLGGIYLAKVPELAGDIIRQALAEGINLFDTALLYGCSESLIGDTIKEGEAVLVTKSLAAKGDKLLQDIDLSRKQLKVDVIDIYMLHNIMDEERFDAALPGGELLDTLYRAREEGKIRYLGVSSHREELLIELIKTGAFDVVELPFNVIDRYVWEEALTLAVSKNIGTIAMKPLAGGVFNILSPELSPLALRYLLPFPLSTIAVGVKCVEEVIQNAAAVQSLVPLSEEELFLLCEATDKLGRSFCRQCDYCASSCPVSIPISHILTLWKQYTCGGMQEVSKKRYGALEVSGADCIKCGKCEEKCPYSLPIRELLTNVDGLLRGR